MEKQYKCIICGYIHMGEEPLEICPICGATKENFVLEDMKSRKKLPTGYRCLNCEYIHDGKELPEICPICGLSKDHFEPIGATNYEQVKHNGLEYVILGGGIAGLTAAETLRKHGPDVKITLITNEQRLPYYRLNLTRLLGAEILESALSIHNQYWYDENRIQILMNRVVTDVDRDHKKVILSDGNWIHYDRLIIALGAHPFIPPIKGISSRGILSFRDLNDAQTLIRQLKPNERVGIIGGGVLGLEIAGALAKRHGKITVFEGSKWLMPRQLNQSAAKYIANELNDLNIDVEYEFRTKEIELSPGGFKIIDESGKAIEVDYVIVTTGVRPNTYLAIKAGLEVNNGLVVNNHMCTSDVHIYAAGDVTEHYGITYGLWNIAMQQGRLAGLNALGILEPFGGVPRSNGLKVLSADLFSIGDINPVDASYQVLEKNEDNRYLMFVIKDQKIVGSIAIGYQEITHYIKGKVEENRAIDPMILQSIDALLNWIRKE